MVFDPVLRGWVKNPSLAGEGGSSTESSGLGAGAGWRRGCAGKAASLLPGRGPAAGVGRQRNVLEEQATLDRLFGTGYGRG